MKTVSHRVRTAVVAVLAALAMAVVPAVAAHAEGPGSATLTFMSDGEPVQSSLFYEGPDGVGFAFSGFNGVIELTDLALGEYIGTFDASDTTQPVGVYFQLTAEEPNYQAEIEVPRWPTGTGSITGTVTAGGDPVDLAEVSMMELWTGRIFPTITTGVDGGFSFADLAEGTYQIEVYVDGFSRPVTTIDLADGEAATLEVILLARDAAISGRVVDENGLGVEGVAASAATDSDQGYIGFTDADGYYTIENLVEGEWTVSIGGSDFPWEHTSVVVTVAAGSTATAPDLVAVLRTTGTINGLVVGADQPPEASGLGDVCVNVVTLDGVDVPGATGLTEIAGNYYVEQVPPGEYTVRFTDCDPARDPRYQSAYLGDTTDLAEATTFTVDVGDNLWVGFVHLTPVGAQPEPEAAPVPVRNRDLVPEDEGAIGAMGDLFEGQRFAVQVGIEYAGEWVSIWLRTPTTDLGGWHLVADDGSVTVLVPASFPPTSHRLVVQDAYNEVIGWKTVQLAKPGRGQGEP